MRVPQKQRQSNLVEGSERGLQCDPLLLPRELQHPAQAALGGLRGLVLATDKSHELLRAHDKIAVAVVTAVAVAVPAG